MRASLFESLESRELFSVAPIAAAKGQAPAAQSAMIQKKDQDRLRDGSCQRAATSAPATVVSVDATKDQIHQRLRDGSCKA